MIYDLLVVGAGPAGLFAAGAASEKLKNVLLLEKQSEPGRKLLLTGSGQCNFTNIRPLPEFLHAYGTHGLFLKPALYHFTNQAAIAFFKTHGVESVVVEDTGKVFPRSHRSRDILKVLLERCRQHGVEVRYQHPVTRVEHKSDGSFRVYTLSPINTLPRTAGIHKGRSGHDIRYPAASRRVLHSGTHEFCARRLLIATGGQSYPATGSTGDGYRLAHSLGHACVPPRPGLTPFMIRDFPWEGLAGTSFKDMPVTVWHKDKKVKTLTGDWLITHHGISGPVVQNLARYALAGDQVTVALVPFEHIETFKNEWDALLARSAKLSLKAWLKYFPLTQALTRSLMELAQVSPAETVAHLNREKRLAFFEWLTAFPLVIQRLGDFDTAMVTCGGVALDEVNAKTMESRLVPGLYFAGEVLDIDGDCGGYDLQAAWSTAALAASKMIS
jgi:predicted Rossmann fold flavoprotein